MFPSLVKTQIKDSGSRDLEVITATWFVLNMETRPNPDVKLAIPSLPNPPY